MFHSLTPRAFAFHDSPRNIFRKPQLACRPHGRELLYALDGSDLKVFSQNGEDGVLRSIFWALGEGTRSCIEIGAGDGGENNTHLLMHHGWDYLWLDASAPPNHPHVRREWVTAENVAHLLRRYDAPAAPDCLSIDTDFNDIYILSALLRADYRPRVLVVEYNAACGPEACLAVQYDSAGKWQGTDYFGASLAAYVHVGRRFGYSLVYCEASGNNAFFVLDPYVDSARLRPPAQLWRPPGYGGHRPDPQQRMAPFQLH